MFFIQENALENVVWKWWPFSPDIYVLILSAMIYLTISWVTLNNTVWFIMGKKIEKEYV